MAKEAKLITSSVNLPINVINTVINIDDRHLEVGIDSMIDSFQKNDIEFIRTMNTTVTLDNHLEQTKYVNPEYIHINHGISYINNVEKRIMNEKNMEYTKNNLKFYKIEVEYCDGRVSEWIVPSYVKFYSMHKGTFVPVEQLKNRDILMEVGDRMVKVSDAELINDYEIPSEYYNIKVTFERQYDEEECIKEYPNLYVNGILINVAYFNFNKTFENDHSNE